MQANDPIARFHETFARARAAGHQQPEAMALATVDPQGRPSVRMVLCKGVSEAGFLFFTNLQSRKGQELLSSKRAALCFYWDALDEQVRVEGEALPVSDEEADGYFRTRPRGSQIGAWASDQSRPLPTRETLEERLTSVELRFTGVEVPRPPHWSGFRVVPHRIEFWIGRPSRLHDRFVYERHGDGWKVQRLYP